jgi:hypothetical protein
MPREIIDLWKATKAFSRRQLLPVVLMTEPIGSVEILRELQDRAVV